jgi:predicted phosphate transport protein (TIGR00153 family)
MDFRSLLKIFIPEDKKFFPLFEQASANLLQISKVLCDAVNTSSSEKRKELIKEIERLEHVGDDIAYSIFHELSTNFITPFDREDIHQLASVIDDVLDYIHGSAKRIQLYKIETMTPAIIKLAELIYKSSEELNNAVLAMRDMKNPGRIREACVKINSIENHADDIFDMEIAKLFEEETNAIEIIKMKDVLQSLETATDKCEDAANVLESIIVKNA